MVLTRSRQQEPKDNAAELQQPQKKINQQGEGKPETCVNLSPEKVLNSKPDQVTQEIGSSSKQLEKDEENINHRQDQLTSEPNSLSHQVEKNKESGNCESQTIKETKQISEQSKEVDKIIDSEPKKIINETEKILNNEPEKIINKEPEKIINKEPKKTVNNEPNKTISDELNQISQAINSDTEQPVVSNKVNCNTQWSEESKQITNSELDQTEKEVIGNQPQSEQEKQIIIQPDQTTEELNCTPQQPEKEKEVAEDPDCQTQHDKDCKTEANSQSIEDDNSSEFEIIDVAEYDPEFPTEDSDSKPNSSAKDANEAAETVNDKTKSDKTKNDKSKSPRKLTDNQKRRLMKNLEWQVVHGKLNPNNLPPSAWKSLKQLSGAQRRTFLRSMKEKFAKKKSQGAGCSLNERVKQGMLNDLTSSLSQFLLQQLGMDTAMQLNTEGNVARRNTENKIEKLNTEAQRRRFTRNVERMIDRNIIDVNNLPPKIWNSLKQLKWGERNKFLKAMKERAAQKGDLEHSLSQPQAAFAPESSNTTMKRYFSESDKLPSHSFGGNSQTQAPSTNKNKGKGGPGKSSSYSFDRDFQSQRFTEQSTPNIETTSKVSPNVFSLFSQNRYSQAHTPGKTTFFNDYTGQPFRSFSDSFQTRNREEAAFMGSSGSSNLFSPYGNKTMKEGANRPSYSYGSDFQSPSYDSSRNYNVGYTGREINFPTQNYGNAQQTTGRSPYGNRYTDNLKMQGGLSRAGSYSSHRATELNALKRKLLDNISSYGKPQPKRPNMSSSKSFSNARDDSIKVTITDKGSPNGIMGDVEAGLLSAKLLQLLDQFSLSSQGHIPRFYNSGLSQGVFKITCADQKSLDWLKGTVANLPELWRGAHLHVDAGALTAQFSSKRVRVHVFIPGASEDSEVALQRLQRQNPGLNTGAWKFLRQTENSRGRVFSLEIDEPSVEVLRKKDFKAFLGLSCVTFQVQGNTQKKGKARYH